MSTELLVWIYALSALVGVAAGASLGVWAYYHWIEPWILRVLEERRG